MEDDLGLWVCQSQWGSVLNMHFSNGQSHIFISFQNGG